MIGEPAAEIGNFDEHRLTKEISRDITIDNISEEAISLAKKYGYLPYMVQRYIDMLGFEDTIELLNSFENYSYRPALLCNMLKIECKDLVERLSKLGFVIEPISWCSYSYTIIEKASRPSIGSTHEYLKGFYYIYRDAASLLPVVLMSPLPESKVLDMCAAPGGKTVHTLIRMRDRGLLVANDISKARLKALTANLFRMGFKSYVIISENGRNLPKKVTMRFDYVLLDAPCSAEGAIMFDKSRKTKTTQKDLVRLVLREIMLLLSAIKMAREGGRIVYTTCSIAPEENEYVITKVIELMGDSIEIEKPEIDIGNRGLERFRNIDFHSKVTRCIRIWPHKHHMEGYFVCILRRV